MGTIAQKLAKLLATKADIKAAITEKGQVPGDVFADYPEKIRAIQTGVDTSDATAAASDIVSPKTAYVNGIKVSGSITEYPSGNIVVSDCTASQGLVGATPTLRFGKTLDYDLVGRRGKSVLSSTPLTNLGDATAADVAQGKTFTSSAGVRVSGTASPPQQSIKFTFTLDASGYYAGICCRGKGLGLYTFTQPTVITFDIFINDVIVLVYDADLSIGRGAGLTEIGDYFVSENRRRTNVYQVETLAWGDTYIILDNPYT